MTTLSYNLIYGGLNTSGGTTEQTLSANVPEILVLEDAGLSDNTTPDPANNNIVLLHDGVYYVSFSCSFSGSSNSVVSMEVRINDLPTVILGTRKIGTGGDVGSMTFGYCVFANKSDNFSIWVKSDSTNITVVDALFFVNKIG